MPKKWLQEWQQTTLFLSSFVWPYHRWVAFRLSGEYTLAIFHRILKGSHIPVGTTSIKKQECSPITISVIRIRVQVPHCPLRLRTCTVHSLFRSGNGLNLCCSTLSPANPEKTNLEKGLFQGTDEALYRRYKSTNIISDRPTSTHAVAVARPLEAGTSPINL